MSTGKTYEHSRSGLRNALRLTQDQMPMFATLCGNDLIDFDELRTFHTSLGQFHTKFFKIADYVRTKFTSQATVDDRSLDEIAKRTKLTRQKLLNSLEWYDINYISRKDPMDEFAGGLSCVRHILSKNPQTVSLDFCDLRTPSLLNLRELWIPLFERQLGVALYHLNDSSHRTLIRTRLAHSDRAFYDLEIKPNHPDCELA